MTWKGVDPAVWAQEAKDKLKDAFRESVQALGDEMAEGTPSAIAQHGDLPEVSGNLGNSVLIRINAPVTVAPSGTKFAGASLAEAQRLEIGDDAYLGYQAAYARRINGGFTGQDSLGRTYNQSGKGFVERARSKWGQIVEQATIRVRTRSGG